MLKIGIDLGSAQNKILIIENNQIKSKLTLSSREDKLKDLLRILDDLTYPDDIYVKVGVTGSGRNRLLDLGKDSLVNEIVAVSKSIWTQYPKVSSIVDMGGAFSKWIKLTSDGGVENFATNGLCAAGAGVFLEQQANRLKLSISELSELAYNAQKGVAIAGRCSVFAKSDMIHLQQKGTPVDEIAYGLCQALIRTFSSTVMQSKKLTLPVALVGGGTGNAGLVKAFKEIFKLKDEDVFIPEDYLYAGALGAALWNESTGITLSEFKRILNQENEIHNSESLDLEPLGPYENQGIQKQEDPPLNADGTISAYLGMDVGSVSTNFVLLDENLNVIQGLYLQTKGRPIEVIKTGLKKIYEKFGDNLKIKGVGSTGSGRHLAAAMVGADIVKNEITAQMVSAAHYLPKVDTIFEIGGQDSKYIRVDHGSMADFEMNKICAAGTGSFLEEQADKLGINIINEFAEYAEKADNPSDLGSQCTVFMDTELVYSLGKGESKENLCAGLSYSIVRNYLEKVVAHRPIGDHIVFQGGTASNKAVVRAFEKILGKTITVHPYNRISGAIGSALIAKKAKLQNSNFRGFNATEDLSVSTFECKICSNRCQVSKIKIGNDTVFFGDACERFSNKKKTSSKANSSEIEIISLRNRLLHEVMPTSNNKKRPKMGIVTASISKELLPLWANLIDRLGYEPIFSDDPNANTLKEGIKPIPHEVCMPLKLVSGQVSELFSKKKVDKVFFPSVTELPGKQKIENTVVKNLPNTDRTSVCIYTQQIPFMLQRYWGKEKVLTPQFSLEKQSGGYIEAVREISKSLNKNTILVASALEYSISKYFDFVKRRQEIGKKLLKSNFNKAVVLIGKPYTIYDSYLNMGLFNHLSKLGFDIIPQDLLPLDDIEVEEHMGNLPWIFARDSLRAVKIVKDDERLFPIMISNFGCGTDAFSFKHFEGMLRNKPYLVLEFDELRGEAGMVTRLEAFSDSVSSYLNENVKKRSSLPLVHQKYDLSSVRRFFLPDMGPHTFVFEGLLRSLGNKEVHLMKSPDIHSIRMGEEVSSGKECHPFSCIAGDILRFAKENTVHPSDAIYMVSTVTPCLLPQYGDGIRVALRDRKIPLQIWDVSSNEQWDIFGFKGLMYMMDGLAAIDHLIILEHRFRPYELNKGSVDKIVKKAMKSISDLLAQMKSPIDAFAQAVSEFRTLKLKNIERKPIVGLTGDLYTRLNASTNSNLARRLEEMGCEVYYSPYMASLIEFSNYNDAFRWAERLQLKPAVWETLAVVATESRMRQFREILGKDFGNLCLEPPYEEMRTLAKPYVGLKSNYLVVTTIGKFVDFARKNIDGVISAIGINCMVGTASGAAMDKISKDFNNIPMLTMVYGGNEGAVQNLKLETFVQQVKDYNRIKKSASSTPENLKFGN